MTADNIPVIPLIQIAGKYSIGNSKTFTTE
jgi:hypothetical protein